jgi:superfamily II DNA or RNA helicase
MSLKDLNIKVSYSSSRGDNILEDFYVPCLSNSCVYRRTAAYFSSNSLAVAARGIADFINKNNGSMQLICNVCLSESDKTIIENHVARLQKDFVVDLDNLEDELKKDHLRCLGWMLKNEKLEIKIAVIENKPGIQHEKIGILEDSEGNVLSFMGSENETWMGWLGNNEKFHVFRSWNLGEKEHLDSDIVDFNSYWNNDARGASVYAIDDAVKNGLIKTAPKTSEEFVVLSEKMTMKLLRRNKEILGGGLPQKEWPHKKVAMNTFVKKKNGVIEMATGTGKTSVAINILNRLLDEKKVNGAIISTFGNDLLDQWYNELSDRANTNLVIYRYYRDYRELEDFINDDEGSVLLLNWENLDKALLHGELTNSKLIVIDEVHGFGAESLRTRLQGKMSPIPYRLGLSATPEREYDEIGNEFIEKEIGPVIFRYDLKDAIRDNILCEFDYVPLSYQLSEEDKEGIKRAYRAYSARTKNNIPENEARIQLYMDLAAVRKLSVNKIPVFRNHVKSHPKVLDNCIIFVETMEYGKLVQEVVIDVVHNYHTYYHDDEKENFEKFSRGELKLLITCKRLSQGIDVRSLKSIVLFSSSRGRLETIQRIGRCLRTDPKNPYKRAIVLDFVVANKDRKDMEVYDDADESRERWLSDLSKTRRA